MKKKFHIEVTCFSNTDINDIEEEINAFLHDSDIDTDTLIEIKWSTCVDENNVYFNAMVIYKIEE